MFLALAALLLAGASPAHAKGKSGKARSGPEHFAAAQGVLEGKITRFLLNPHAEIDGFLLDSGAAVKWPAHSGAALAAAFGPGTAVRVAGYHDRKGNFKVHQIQAAQGGPVLHNAPPAVYTPKIPGFLRDARLEALTVEGKIARVLAGREGEPRLILLDSGAQVHVPRHAAWVVSRLAAQGSQLKAEGFGRRSPHGVALRATILTPAGEASVPLYDQPIR